jgi:hypothetical protein
MKEVRFEEVFGVAPESIPGYQPEKAQLLGCDKNGRLKFIPISDDGVITIGGK